MKTIIISPSTGTIPVITSNQIVLLKPGVYTSPLRFAGSSITIAAENPAARPLFRVLHEPVKMVGPSANVRVRNFDCLATGTTATGTNGLSLAQKGSADIVCEDLSFTGYGYSSVIQHPKIENAPRSEWLKSIALRRCRFLDAPITYRYSGQNCFAANVDGLLIEGCTLDCAGYKPGQSAGVYAHNAYLSKWTANVVARGNYFGHAAMYSVQARGGGIFGGNIFDDAATSLLVNGLVSTVTGNVFIAGHFTKLGAGQGGCEWSCGSGSIDGNLHVHGPVPAHKEYVQPAWWQNRRKLSPKPNDWEYQGKLGWAFGDNRQAGYGAVKLPPGFNGQARAGKADIAATVADLKRQAGF